MVILTHTASGWVSANAAFRDTSSIAPTFALPRALAVIANAGVNGVQLFFIVSAFTLTVSARSHRSAIGAYALRRMARIAPAFWMATAFYLLLASIDDPSYLSKVSLADLLTSTAFLGGWRDTALNVGVPGGWSIACEAAFYVVLPFIIWLIDGRLWRAVVLTGLAAMVAQLRARHMIVADTWSFLAYTHPLQQLPVFLCGVTAALVAMRTKVPRLPGLANVLLGLAVCVVPFDGNLFGSWWILPYLLFSAVATCVVLLAAAHPPCMLANSVMRKIGEVSYSMYLVHFVLLASSLRAAEWLCPADDARTLACHFVFTTLSTFCVAVVTHRLIERPPIRWAARQFARPSVALLH